MHEVAVATALVAQAERAAGGHRVIAVNVRLGRLSGVVADSLEFGFQIARQGTALEAARLVVELVEPVIWCTSCHAAVELDSTTRFRCPVCDTPSALVLAGKELELRSLDVVEGPDDDRTKRDDVLESGRS